MDRLFIISPAYNEAENINAFIDDWYPVILKHDAKGTSRLVVIDDGSTDDTYRIIRDRVDSLPLLEVITKKNSGHGPTLIYGYEYALECGADYIFQTDSDGQTSPDEFESFWDMRHEHAAVFGFRPVRGDGFSRKIVEKVLCGVVKLIFGVSLPDANAPFRLMSRAYVKHYLSKMPSDYNLPNVILTVCGAYYHDDIFFSGISFKPRQGGTNSINIKKIFKIGCKAITDFKTIKARL
ncbi:MAG: glycosyltransferase family 2 protein [Lachnospiraceae bacterium]|nr:glycosyltransferase family 2 protein [Lachnospiraceae bacterium]